MRVFRAIGTLALCIAAGGAAAQAPVSTSRPKARPAQTVVAVAGQAGFAGWIAGFRPRANAAGISDATLDAAFSGVAYDPEVIKRDRNQAEFTKTIWDYLGTAVSDLRVQNGRKALKANAALLDRIEAQYGVDKQIIVAIWGLESAYGTFRGSKPVIGSLASLAYDSPRGAYFESELLNALQILQSGDTQPRHMRGSWAGAMGHTQFMPGSFLKLAVDWTGDGRRDIWGDEPADALASTANYLRANGWTHGQPWGVEVVVPAGFDYTQADRKIIKAPSAWAALGVLDIHGKPVPDHGDAALLLPAGHTGAAFLIFDNFEVLESYNTADAYVIGVGHLGDRILGGEAIQGDWPLQDRALTYDERIELQTRLREAGFDPQKIDGKIGPLTIDAVRAYQVATGEVPDGYASLRVLQSLR